ncbi:hypothetical protein WNY97_04865 [Pseudoalteromonas fuliginea]|uniref:hypothetical protein n=1 Tax=Pseudoalteromonas TaxID=53246 RepID=UPI0002AAC0FD|nr:hypothetical protein [Pseudoalteromonas sp. Bsw20308]
MKWNFLRLSPWLIALTLLIFSHNIFAQQYKTDKPANWVNTHIIDQPKHSDITKVRDGTLYLLLDNQSYIPSRQKQQRYTRLVMKALNQSVLII